MEAEVRELRSQLTQPSPSPGELPGAADLLNQLKSRRKRSATTLADIEAILEMLPASTSATDKEKAEIEEWQKKFWEAEGFAQTQVKAVAEAHRKLQELEKKLGRRR